MFAIHGLNDEISTKYTLETSRTFTKHYGTLNETSHLNRLLVAIALAKVTAAIALSFAKQIRQ